ncbi:hypothetical protein Glove_16g83 [Diversispora epigaea]|uniref:Restriction endonuclease type IV Mrr domain-containing protein n=1 Tax=Diversispora epigaea TaxID=1348612 RepID=A0A397JVL0_9GLOM|nr:hypothetical protein Glove_16g83 [Diversispora epigaea]
MTKFQQEENSSVQKESSSKEIPKTPIALKYSKKLYEFCIQNAEIYIQTRMNDPDLEKEMKLGFEKFLKCLDAYLDFYDKKLSEHEEIDIKFHIYSEEIFPVQKGKNFEMKIEKLLTDANIKCEITGGPGDKGIDIKGMKKGVKFIIECKNWRTKNIDRSIINQIEGVLSRQSNGTIGIVTAPSINRYTPGAKETARTTK